MYCSSKQPFVGARAFRDDPENGCGGDNKLPGNICYS